MDKLLESLGLTYSELTETEKETYQSWITELENSSVTPEKQVSFLGSIRAAIEQELTKADNSKNQDIYLKARLRNIIILEAFMTSGDRAKRAIEEQLKRKVPA